MIERSDRERARKPEAMFVPDLKVSPTKPAKRSPILNPLGNRLSQKCASSIFALLLSANLAHGQSEGGTANEWQATESSPAPDEPASAAPPAQRTLGARIVLEDTSLEEIAIRRALERELRVAVTVNAPEAPLRIDVKGNSLIARFDQGDGRTVERRLELPEEPSRQLETIALLAGNLVRDEASELLASLSPKVPEAEPSQPSETLAATAPPPPKATKPTPEPPPGEAKDNPAPKEAAAASEHQSDTAPPFEKDPLALNLSLAHPLALYPDSHERVVHLDLGLAYSRSGLLDGFGLTAFVARSDRGVEGAQIAGVWSWSRGPVSGANVGGFLATSEGGVRGIELGGFASYGAGDVLGLQWGGTFAVAGDLFADDVDAPRQGNLTGGQAAGLAAVALGAVRGFQAAGAGSFSGGSVEGFQASGFGNYAQGSVSGFQASGFGNVARGPVVGFQAAPANYSESSTRGLQVGVANVSQEMNGLQLGVVNVGKRVKGSQIGLVNVADEMDGFPLGLVNVIKSVRTQAVTWVDFSESGAEVDRVNTPFIHVGVKYLSGPIYTMLSFGVAGEAEPCSSGNGVCTGADPVLAPGFALGGRVDVTNFFFFEMDALYQREDTFQGRPLEGVHSVLGRAELGVQVLPRVAVVGGGGPRLEIDDAGNTAWNPNYFAGLQFF